MLLSTQQHERARPFLKHFHDVKCEGAEYLGYEAMFRSMYFGIMNGHQHDEKEVTAIMNLFVKARALGCKKVFVLFMEAYFLSQHGKCGDALRAFLRLMKANPYYVPGLLCLARLQQDNQKLKTLQNSFHAARFNLYRVQATMENIDDALINSCILRSVRRLSAYMVAHSGFHYASAVERYSQDGKEAHGHPAPLSIHKSSIANFRAHVPSLRSMARLYEHAGDLGKARRLLLDVVKISPVDPSANLLLAQVELRGSRHFVQNVHAMPHWLLAPAASLPKKTTANVQKCLKLVTPSAGFDALFEAAIALDFSLRDHAGAMKLYSDCLFLLDSPSSSQSSCWTKADLLCCVAMCQLTIKMKLSQEVGEALREAASTLSKALENDGQHVPSLVQISVITAVLGDYDSAELTLRKAVVNAVSQTKRAASAIKIGIEGNEIRSE